MSKRKKPGTRYVAHARISKDEHEWLLRHALTLDRAQSWIVRKALAEYREREEKRRRAAA